MKRISHYLIMLVAMVLPAVLQSCDDGNDDEYRKLYPNAIVTVKTAADNTVYLQLDNNTTLYPENITKHPFEGKEVRARINFERTKGQANGYTTAVHVNWMDSILTKATVPSLGGDEENKKYGDNAIEVVDSWETVCEDGYLTLRLRTIWGTQHKPHYLNLVSGTNPDNPYELELRHNADGDTVGYMGDALVAFNLSALPDTQGQTVDLKIKYKGFDNDKTITFKYKTRAAQ